MSIGLGAALAILGAAGVIGAGLVFAFRRSTHVTWRKCAGFVGRSFTDPRNSEVEERARIVRYTAPSGKVLFTTTIGLDERLALDAEIPVLVHPDESKVVVDRFLATYSGEIVVFAISFAC